MGWIYYGSCDISIGFGFFIRSMVPIIDDDQFPLFPLNHPRITDIPCSMIPAPDGNLVPPCFTLIITQAQMYPGTKITSVNVTQSSPDIHQEHQRGRQSS